MFLFRRDQESDPLKRVEVLEDAHLSLVRSFEAYQARMTETVELLALIALPPWLRECIELAKRSGWSVMVTPKGLLFQRFDEPDISYEVPLPLPDDETRCSHVRAQLQVRVRTLGSRAA
jgi:hypothetical protein